MIDLENVSLNCKAHYLNLLLRKKYKGVQKSLDLSRYAKEWEKLVNNNGPAYLVEDLLQSTFNLYFRDYADYLLTSQGLRRFFNPIKAEQTINKAILFYKEL